MSRVHKWIDFEKFVSLHGEYGALGILENVERRESIHYSEPLDLEMRWNAVMNYVSLQKQNDDSITQS